MPLTWQRSTLWRRTNSAESNQVSRHMGWLNESFCQIQIAITAPILGTLVIWFKPSSQIGMVISRNKSYHRRKSRQRFEGERCLRELTKFLRKQNGRKLQKVAENGVELKPIVFALFTQTWKKHLRETRKCLIFSVDQTGLEPVTSRLWVCCSNQLSYKSEILQWIGRLMVPVFKCVCKDIYFYWNKKHLSS